MLQPVQLTAKIGLPLVEHRNFGLLKFIRFKVSFILCYVGVYIFSDVVNVALIILIWLQHVLLDLIPRNIDNRIDRFLYLSAVAELVCLQFILFILSICPSTKSWIDRSTVLLEGCSSLDFQLGVCCLVIDLLFSQFHYLILNFFYFGSPTLNFWAQGSRFIREGVVLLLVAKLLLQTQVSSPLLLNCLQELLLPIAPKLFLPIALVWFYRLSYWIDHFCIFNCFIQN